VGKSPLEKALARLYPELHRTLQPLVLYNSRSPRPGEKDGTDYCFRTRRYIERMRTHEHIVVMDVRGDLQALDLDELTIRLNRGDVLFEGNPYVGRLLQTHQALSHVTRLSLFMSPLSRSEIEYVQKATPGVCMEDLVTDVMRRKLLRRTRRQKGTLSLRDLENVERRAASAYDELQQAHRFHHVIVNHDGEDSEHWDAFYYPIGDALMSLRAFVALLHGQVPPEVESWDEALLGQNPS
jgi:guanylate kinase